MYDVSVYAEYIEDSICVASEADDTDADGRYVIDDLPEHSYEVTAQAAYIRGYERITKAAVPAGSKNVDFQLKRK